MAVSREAQLRKALMLGKALNALAVAAPSAAGAIAFRVFCSPRKPVSRARDAAVLNEARAGFFSAEGLQIATYTWERSGTAAAAPTVLLLHGWESNAARWYNYLEALLDLGYRVVALDAPAHGRSEGRMVNLPMYSRVVCRYMEEFGAPYAMVGHSLGGAAVLMSMAMSGTQSVHKAVVLGSFAESARVIDDYFGMLGAGPSVRSAVYRTVRIRSGVDIRDFSVAGSAGKLRAVQGLVVHDLYDDVSPVAEGRQIAEAWGAEFFQTEGYGHRLQHDAVVYKVCSFLKN